MKLFTLFEQDGEYIPFDRSKSTAHTIAIQLVRVAQGKAGGKKHKAKSIAHQMADRLHTDVVRVIDEELGVKHPEIDIRA